MKEHNILTRKSLKTINRCANTAKLLKSTRKKVDGTKARMNAVIAKNKINTEEFERCNDILTERLHRAKEIVEQGADVVTLCEAIETQMEQGIYSSAALLEATKLQQYLQSRRQHHQ